MTSQTRSVGLLLVLLNKFLFRVPVKPTIEQQQGFE